MPAHKQQYCPVFDKHSISSGRAHAVTPTVVSCAANCARRGGLSSQEEYSFSLTQYMVVLDKPIGLTLAPDPSTGHVYVQHVQQGMSAAESNLVLVSDHIVQHTACMHCTVLTQQQSQ